ncbi:GntR family transcriptional regulator [Bifidobacterium italicum]|uniref:GntR family transcriptional regulator n=1 Tax=Bifidobacterium italicum TaxID=1960968 RepID=A0A2A2EL05_9BIFI|nr:GntR family transcriptional regulator [Bifidobacterium italicum]PAU69608.1 GntR family transcriptional regulator [Bifidobacterium italicum]
MATERTTATAEPTAAVSRAIHDIHLLANVDELGVGDHLPAERALAERLQVSLSTVRAALGVMRARGEISTRRGRAGTVITTDIARHALPSRVTVNAKSARIIDRTSASTSGLPHMLASQGMACVTTVLDAHVQHCDERICQMFHVPASQPLIRVERVRSVDGAPISYEQTYLDPRGYPDFLDFDLTRSIYQLLQFNHGTVIHAVEETIEMIPGFGRPARALRLPSGTPLLYVCSRAADALGNTVVASDDIYPAAHVRLTTARTLR